MGGLTAHMPQLESPCVTTTEACVLWRLCCATQNVTHHNEGTAQKQDQREFFWQPCPRTVVLFPILDPNWNLDPNFALPMFQDFRLRLKLNHWLFWISSLLNLFSDLGTCQPSGPTGDTYIHTYIHTYIVIIIKGMCVYVYMYIYMCVYIYIWSSLVSQCRRRRFDCWVGKIPWRRKWQPTPVSLPGKSHGQGSLVGCSSWGRIESDTT